jgi:hypothetical protein
MIAARGAICQEFALTSGADRPAMWQSRSIASTRGGGLRLGPALAAGGSLP